VQYSTSNRHSVPLPLYRRTFEGAPYIFIWGQIMTDTLSVEWPSGSDVTETAVTYYVSSGQHALPSWTDAIPFCGYTTGFRYILPS
jgi:hypothetical protein